MKLNRENLPHIIKDMIQTKTTKLIVKLLPKAFLPIWIKQIERKCKMCGIKKETLERVTKECVKVKENKAERNNIIERNKQGIKNIKMPKSNLCWHVAKSTFEG